MFSGPVWPGLNGEKRNSGRKHKKKKSTPFEVSTQCQSSVSPVTQFWLFLRICYDDNDDDDDDIITEFATSCPLLVL